MSNSIINTVAYKRALSEHKIVYDRFNNCNLNINIKKNNNSLNRCFTLSFVFDNSNFKLEFDDKYPFYPPKFYINNIPYNKILYLNNSIIIDIIQTTFNKQCLCCDSILCYVKWSPAIKIDKIMDEYIKFKKIIIYCINKKELLELNTENNNILPYEIIEKIGSYF